MNTKTLFGGRATGSSLSELSVCKEIAKAVYFRGVSHMYAMFCFLGNPTLAHFRPTDHPLMRLQDPLSLPLPLFKIQITK